MAVPTHVIPQQQQQQQLELLHVADDAAIDITAGTPI